MKLRSHQRELLDYLETGGTGTVWAHVTPGGGKSLLPQIVCSQLLRRGVIDKICWVTPRKALQEQAALNFEDPAFRQLVGHQYELMESTNEIDPTKGTAGYAVTYNAIDHARRAGTPYHEHEFERHRYGLILDEPHHIRVGGEWEKSIGPLIDRSKFVMYMTGTLDPGHGQRIAFLKYQPVLSGYVPVLENTDDFRFIRYNRGQALEEQAIIELLFSQVDGSATYLDRDGEKIDVTSLAEADDNTASNALFTAIKTGYAEQLLSKAYTHWRHHRETTNPRAQMLVVCSSIGQARLLKNMSQIPDAKIATCDEQQEAYAAIRSFRGGQTPVLFTVAMAYEGLDVPAITHIAGLTLFRSTAWIEQMFARATRFDRQSHLPWEYQKAYVFVPDDPMMNAIITKIREEQEPFVRRGKEGPPPPPPPGPPRPPKATIVPLAGEITRVRASALDGAELGYAETERLQAAMDRHGIVGINPLQIKNLIVEVGIVPLHEGSEASIKSDAVPLTTPAQRRKQLSNTIESHGRAWAQAHYDNPQPKEYMAMNSHIKTRWGKGRNEMDESELTEVFIWIQERYPLADNENGI